MKLVGKKDIAGAVKEAHQKINEIAENERHEEETTHAAMGIVYHLKYEEAKKIQANLREPTPLIDAEALERGTTRHRMANMIMEKHAAWIKRMAEIEVKRIRAKNEVATLKDVRQIKDFHNTILGGE